MWKIMKKSMMLVAVVMLLLTFGVPESPYCYVRVIVSVRGERRGFNCA